MASKYYIKVSRAWVWQKDEKGDGIRRNIGEQVPKEALKDSKLIKRLLAEKVIEVRRIDTNEKVATEYDFVAMADSDIEYLGKNSNWQKIIEKVGFVNYKPSVLKKLKSAIGSNPSYVNKDVVVKAIDDKLALCSDVYSDIVDISKEIASLESKDEPKKMYYKKH